jgi:hypothetical protein
MKAFVVSRLAKRSAELAGDMKKTQAILSEGGKPDRLVIFMESVIDGPPVSVDGKFRRVATTARRDRLSGCTAPGITVKGRPVPIIATGAGYAGGHGAREVVLRGRLFSLREARPASRSAFTRREA